MIGDIQQSLLPILFQFEKLSIPSRVVEKINSFRRIAFDIIEARHSIFQTESDIRMFSTDKSILFGSVNRPENTRGYQEMCGMGVRVR